MSVRPSVCLTSVPDPPVLQTERRTDDMQSQDALCIVHRTVTKTPIGFIIGQAGSSHVLFCMKSLCPGLPEALCYLSIQRKLQCCSLSSVWMENVHLQQDAGSGHVNIIGALSARLSVNCQLNGLTDVEAVKLDVRETLPDGQAMAESVGRSNVNTRPGVRGRPQRGRSAVICGQDRGDR